MAYYNNSVKLISLFYPSLIWKRETKNKEIYLTFDDGPIPEVTDFVLKQLEDFKAKATFFCVGENITKHPDQFLKIALSGHSIGNHTYNHLKGWETPDEEYFKNVEDCNRVISKNLQRLNMDIHTLGKKKLFRPPYGKIKKSQIAVLQKEYQIIMWNVLSGDFDQKQSEQACLNTAIKYTTPGGIIIFHDSLKAEKNLKYALPRYLEHFSKLGYQFKKL